MILPQYIPLTGVLTAQVVAFAVITFGLLIYLAPAIVALKRGASGSGIIFVLNVLIGWTVLGWMAMLVWAAAGDAHPAEAYRRHLARQIRIQALPQFPPVRKTARAFQARPAKVAVRRAYMASGAYDF